MSTTAQLTASSLIDAYTLTKDWEIRFDKDEILPKYIDKKSIVNICHGKVGTLCGGLENFKKDTKHVRMVYKDGVGIILRRDMVTRTNGTCSSSGLVVKPTNLSKAESLYSKWFPHVTDQQTKQALLYSIELFDTLMEESDEIWDAMIDDSTLTNEDYAEKKLNINIMESKNKIDDMKRILAYVEENQLGKPDDKYWTKERIFKGFADKMNNGTFGFGGHTEEYGLTYSGKIKLDNRLLIDDYDSEYTKISKGIIVAHATSHEAKPWAKHLINDFVIGPQLTPKKYNSEMGYYSEYAIGRCFLGAARVDDPFIFYKKYKGVFPYVPFIHCWTLTDDVKAKRDLYETNGKHSDFDTLKNNNNNDEKEKETNNSNIENPLPNMSDEDWLKCKFKSLKNVQNMDLQKLTDAEPYLTNHVCTPQVVLDLWQHRRDLKRSLRIMHSLQALDIIKDKLGNPMGFTSVDDTIFSCGTHMYDLIPN